MLRTDFFALMELKNCLLATLSLLIRHKREFILAIKSKSLLWGMTLSVTLLLCILLLEGGTRLFLHSHQLQTLQIPPYQSIDPYKPNPYIVNYLPYLYFFIPKAHYQAVRTSYQLDYKINTLGFRGEDIPAKSSTGLKRLLIIGDSIVEGHAVLLTQGLVARLNKQLNPYGWEAVNVGMQGASPIYYAANLPRYLSLEPDAILLFIHENDLYEDRVREKSYQQLPVLDDDSFLLAKKSQGISEYSAFLKLLQNIWQSFGASVIKNIVESNLQINWHDAAQKKLDTLSPFLVAETLFARQWKMSAKYLNWIKQRLIKKKIPLLVTSLCTTTLAPGLDKAYQQHCHNLHHFTQKWAKKENIAYYSLLEVMQDTFKKYPVAQVLVTDDSHPTALTHQILASTLFLWLKGFI